MKRNGLSTDALKQIGNLDKKLSAIQVEIRTFMEQKNLEITAIQSQIRGLQGNKRTILLDTEEKFNCKKFKTEHGSDSLNLTSNLRYDGDWVMVFTDGACPHTVAY